MENIKTILEEHQEEIKRHISVLKEDFDQKIGLIGEQHGSIMAKIDSHGEMIASHGEMIASHGEMIESMSARLDSHGEMIASHGEMIESMSARLDSHGEMIASIKEDMEIVKINTELIKDSLKRKVDIDEFAILERRVGILEAKMHRD
ncbi:hypothetical protein KJ616_00040 [Patescibacteria group bacterium]|nr:hypothetical protein [Patescibacteria group bacterium]